MHQKVVFVNGVFDILHLGHIKLLSVARSFPDSYVIVAVDSDARVKQLKGPTRPINNLITRKVILKSMHLVDLVVDFDSDEELVNIIKMVKPEVMVKGADYKNKPIIGAEYCKEIHFVDLTDDSTTKTIQRITSS